MLHVDLDNFRRVNDTLGLVAGDELLRLVARQVRESLRRDDVVSRARRQGDATDDVARIGGDQFMVLLHAIKDAKDAAVVAERLTKPLIVSTPLANRSLSVTASVGVAIYPTDSSDDDALLRHASIAMNGARRRGPGRYAFYDEAMHAGVQNRLKLEASAPDGAREERVLAALPASVRPEHGQDLRHRGAAALEQQRARASHPGRVHPGRRGDRRDSADR